MILVVDYGMGNLRSVAKALQNLGGDVQVRSDPEGVKLADKVVLPGVGAFGDACQELRRRNLFDPLREFLLGEKPFLGICLGLQLLFETSEESVGERGLGICKGKVVRFRTSGLKVPHMGWNQLRIQNTKSPVLKGIQDGSYFYFVHSFYPVPEDPSLVAGSCKYGDEDFLAVLGRGKLWATQFHPEKSQETGLRILKNFINL